MDRQIIWMKHSISRVLEQLPSGQKYRYAEIGVYAGDNAKNMLTIIPTEHAWFVDPWSTSFSGYGHSQEKWDELYKETVSKLSSFPQAEVLKMTSEAAAKIVPNDLDFVYIDAAHDYENTLMDLHLWIHKTQVGGWICGDDFSYDGVEKALYDYLHYYTATTETPIDIFRNENEWWFQRKI